MVSWYDRWEGAPLHILSMKLDVTTTIQKWRYFPDQIGHSAFYQMLCALSEAGSSSNQQGRKDQDEWILQYRN